MSNRFYSHREVMAFWNQHLGPLSCFGGVPKGNYRHCATNEDIEDAMQRLGVPALDAIKVSITYPLSEAKVLIGTPTYFRKEYCAEEFMAGLYEATRAMPCQFKAVILDNSKLNGDYAKKLKDIAARLGFGEELEIRYVGDKFQPDACSREVLAWCCNEFRREVLEDGYTHFLSLEADLVIDAESMKRVLSHHKDPVVFTADAVSEEQLNSRLLFSDDRPMVVSFLSPNLPYEVLDVAGGLFHFTLIAREILERIPFRFVPWQTYHHDVWFCVDCQDHLVKMVGLPGMSYKHMSEKAGQWTMLTEKAGTEGYWNR